MFLLPPLSLCRLGATWPCATFSWEWVGHSMTDLGLSWLAAWLVGCCFLLSIPSRLQRESKLGLIINNPLCSRLPRKIVMNHTDEIGFMTSEGHMNESKYLHKSWKPFSFLSFSLSTCCYVLQTHTWAFVFHPQSVLILAPCWGLTLSGHKQW